MNESEEATATITFTIESPKFTVTFNQDVGMLTRVVTVDEGQPIVLPKTQNSSGQEDVTLSGGGSALFPIVKDFHLFGGWYSDASYAEGSFVGLPGTTITPSADLTLHAKWIPARDICFAQATSTVDAAVTFPAAWVTQWSMGYPTRSCTFGTSPGTRVRVPSDAPFELPVPTRANAGFHGWYAVAQTTDGSTPNGTLVGRGAATHQVAFSSGNVQTYHSQWQTQTFRINFNPNLSGASFDFPPCETVGTTDRCGIRWNPGDAIGPDGRAAVTAPSPTRDGWRFNGWFTSTSGGTRVGDAGDLVSGIANDTVHAQWTQLTLSRSVGAITATRNAAITPWTVTSSGFTATGFSVTPALPAGLSLDGTSGTISGTPTALQPSTTYTITGTGDGSATTTVSISVDPPAPGAPLNLVATPGDRQVTLAWEPPSNAGEITITTYTATGTAAGEPDVTCTTSGTGCTITGLVNGVTYTFTVRVTGPGNADSNVVTVTPTPPAVSGGRPTVPIAATWVPTPQNEQPRVPGAQGEMQREGGQPVQLAAISSRAGEVGYVDDEGMLSIVFTGDTTTNVARGLVATREGMVRCEVCGDMAPGSIVEIWAFSTPRLIAAAVVDERGCIDVMVPLSAPFDGGPAIEAGQHTLQVILSMDDGLGRLAVNVGVTVGGLTPTSLPAGGGMPTGVAGLIGMLGAALVVLVPALRRGRVQEAAGSV